MAWLDQALRAVLISPQFLWIWGVLVAASLGVLAWDLARNNAHLGSFMKWVWGFTVLYSGSVGLAVYVFSGRGQIARDSIWRRAFRSVSHCYSGCGAGEITGVVLAAGLLGLGTVGVVAITFSLAYLFGFAMTMGPLLQEGVGARTALKDTIYSESASIAVMEISAISVDLWLAGDATMAEPVFWASLVFSLTIGLLVAYPVNVWLIRAGVKEGMHDPRHGLEAAA
jgi:hypothetical protein